MYHQPKGEAMTFDPEKHWPWVKPSSRDRLSSGEVRQTVSLLLLENRNTLCVNLKMFFVCLRFECFKCLILFDIINIEAAPLFFSGCRAKGGTAPLLHPPTPQPSNLPSDIFIMEKEQTAASCHAPGQTSVRAWLSSSRRGTSTRLLLLVGHGSQMRIL